jgi:fucose 4-O-acetylase-like acetyltransferase
MSGTLSSVYADGTAARMESTSIAPSPASGWVANVENLRVLAVIGIVWFHTEGAPGRRIAYAGLPIFLLVFYSLIVRQGYNGDQKGFLKRRWKRLIVPWLFWSVVYVACKAVNAVRLGDSSALYAMLTFQTLVTGTHIHLWYLPYAFVTGLIVYLSDRWIPRVHPMAVIWISVWVGLLTLVACQMDLNEHLMPVPLPQWKFALAAVPLGFAIGRCCRLPSRRLLRMHLLAIGVMVALSCLLLNARGYAGLAVPYGIAFPAVCMAYAWPSRRNRVAAQIAALVYGIYLLHPLASYIVVKFLLWDGHFALVVLLTLCASGLVTWCLKRTPARVFV